ncbi:MAG: hypothetical protein JWR11_4483 [Mycobacterium sp.]|jgi:hypothetical protein|nr:hypothetical protein [Mycobacterium sp.]MDT5070059.1 hypothetical protein [Mycobacterium sp.]MDT5179228.1 hypothetical protein [Mycobacterium sp.]
MLYLDPRPQAEVRAIQRIIQANEERRRAKTEGGAADIATAEHHLQSAIDVASDSGVSWQTIGDALGLRRGNAYQRFRRRSRSPRLASSNAAESSRDLT